MFFPLPWCRQVILMSCVLGFFCSLSLAKESSCRMGRFGPDCAFQCRCLGQCDESGECIDSNCQVGWFGPLCQYKDGALISHLYSSPTIDIGVTRNGEECHAIQGPFLMVLTLDFYIKVLSLGLVVAKGPPLNISIEYIGYDGYRTNCDNEVLLRFANRSTSVEFTCQAKELIKYIRYSMTSNTSLCMININKGRLMPLDISAPNSTRSGPQSQSFKEVADGCSDTNNLCGCNALFPNAEMHVIDLTARYNTNIDSVYLYIGRNSTRYFIPFYLFLRAISKNETTILNYMQRVPEGAVARFPLIYSELIKRIEIRFISDNTPLYIPIYICEVEAYGVCPLGKYGLDCSSDCDKECGSRCHDIDGACKYSSADNETGLILTCPVGKYGEGCLKSCDYCNKGRCQHEGLCLIGCLGFSNPPKCDKPCTITTYGVNCDNNCSRNCFESRCRDRTGVCQIGCFSATNYPECTLPCHTGYGLNCTQTCNRCFGNYCLYNGTCAYGCLGYINPPTCNITCPPGFYGTNCSHQCLQCLHSSCSPSTGLCIEGCLGGTDFPYCRQACSKGNYGANCSLSCNKCLNFNCSANGICLGDCVGFSNPPHCNATCMKGTYGINCNKTCPECFKSLCDPSSGHCTLGCLGYSDPPHCITKCFRTLYGLNCLQKCSANCYQSMCHFTTGKCTDGCEDYNDPPECTHECLNNSHGYNCFCNEYCSECSNKTGICDKCKPGFLPDQSKKSCFYDQLLEFNHTLLTEPEDSPLNQFVYFIPISFFIVAFFNCMVAVYFHRLRQARRLSLWEHE